MLLEKNRNYKNNRWPRVAKNEELHKRKRTWMKQNKKWMQRQEININDSQTSTNTSNNM